MSELLFILIFLFVWLGVLAYLLNQVRTPSGWIGRAVLRIMNRRHSALTDWGFGQTLIGPQHAILDVGCGGGRSLAKLADLAPQARICGIDHASASVAESRSLNGALIAAGRIEVIRASVQKLPLLDRSFDLAVAIETHYYWPDLIGSLSEVRRVLHPGGVLLLIAESSRSARFGWLHRLAMAPLRATVLGPDEYQQPLTEAGYTEVRVVTHPKRGWVSVLATVPVATRRGQLLAEPCAAPDTGRM
jgi:SAM-dependent methyltransferase